MKTLAILLIAATTLAGCMVAPRHGGSHHHDRRSHHHDGRGHHHDGRSHHYDGRGHYSQPGHPSHHHGGHRHRRH